mmetsp:Transcript_41392/g.107223  ORF Transcript_41392/g.107223 Transcript_41392/m.107223 type:complete len:176 (-) Transcript_41392:1002-1529(-)
MSISQDVTDGLWLSSVAAEAPSAGRGIENGDLNEGLTASVEQRGKGQQEKGEAGSFLRGMETSHSSPPMVSERATSLKQKGTRGGRNVRDLSQEEIQRLKELAKGEMEPCRVAGWKKMLSNHIVFCVLASAAGERDELGELPGSRTMLAYKIAAMVTGLSVPGVRKHVKNFIENR